MILDKLQVKIIVISLLIFAPSLVYAQQIFTTYRDDGNATVFDGKWTFTQEWKRTSEDMIRFNDGNELSVKTGHDGNNLYVLLDFISQHKFAKFSDYGIVCMTTNSTKEIYPQKDDYCFLVTLGSHSPITLQGGDYLIQTNHFTKTKNDFGLIAIGGISDEHDRYSGIPHNTYEFKIPIKVVGRSDTYGFYVATYDANNNKVYNWPQNITNNEFPAIPSPSKWGHLISPDKSLPEFPWPIFAMASSFLFVLYLSRKQISF